MNRILRTLFACMTMVALAGASSAGEFTAEEEARIKELALEALLERPEVLRLAIERLQSLEEGLAANRARDVLSSRRDEIVNDPNAPSIGNPEGDVTIVEFMDYNCGYCKRATGEVAGLLAADSNVRIVFREFPILGAPSVAAAKAALAAREQGAYEAMHKAMMAQERVTEVSAFSAAAELGLDLERLRRDMASEEVEQHIATSMKLARELGIRGTPAFIIGDRLVAGLAPASDLLDLVKAARTK